MHGDTRWAPWVASAHRDARSERLSGATRLSAALFDRAHSEPNASAGTRGVASRQTLGKLADRAARRRSVVSVAARVADAPGSARRDHAPRDDLYGRQFRHRYGGHRAFLGGLCARKMAPRWVLLMWNGLGTGLLLVILGIAILALPAFAAFGPDPSHLNTWIAYFPFVWLPSGLVPAAVLGHALLWRRLLSRGRRGRSAP